MIKRCDKLKKQKNRMNSKKKELQSIHIYVDKIEDEIIKERIEHILDWYIRKSVFYKRLFYGVSVLLILINASIPIINQISFAYQSITVSIISSVATILTSFMTLFTMKDTWFRYRKHVELIKMECMLYSCKSEIYSDKNRNCILVKRVEEIICSERQEWVQTKSDKNYEANK